MLWNGWKAFDTPSLSTKSINARMKRTSGTHIHIFNRLYCLSNRIKLAESRAYKRLVSLDHVSLHAYCVFVFTVLCKCGIQRRASSTSSLSSSSLWSCKSNHPRWTGSCDYLQPWWKYGCTLKLCIWLSYGNV